MNNNKNTFKKTVSILLIIVLILSMFSIIPFSVNAENNLRNNDTAELETNTTLLSNGKYTASSDLTINSRVTCIGHVELILNDGVNLTINKGINLTGSSSLTISARENGTGQLLINDTDTGLAGIGGDLNQDLSNLTISGGIINVTGGEGGAGIGGGKNGYSGIITINGGTVTSHGGVGGAGIGTGFLEDISCAESSDDGIYIHDGIINATGGEDGAGIGEGETKEFTEDSMTAEIYISGGEVTAYSNNNTSQSDNPNREKQDIGGGGATVSITGGKVKADGGGLTSDNLVIFNWSDPTDSIFAYEINADVELKRTFKDKNTGTEYSAGTYIVNEIHPLENKTLVPPYDFAEYISYIDENGNEKSCKNPVIPNSRMCEFESGWYAVTSSYSISNRITCSGDVHLILCDGFTMNANDGITVNEDSSLTVYGQRGQTGKLISAAQTNYYSGIGSTGFSTYDNKRDSGQITIVGGDISATGGSYGAGIGGGNYGIGNVTVKGGKVNSSGGTNAAGIGGGSVGNGNVEIISGEVTAYGNYQSAAIGSGTRGIGNVEINGGKVIAYGGSSGCGIGAGSFGSSNITITQGDITAVGGSLCAGIGAGIDSDVSVSISGGTVNAQGGSNSAGIGGAQYTGSSDSFTVDVTVNGGDITAFGGDYAAGIGGGREYGYDSYGDIHIEINDGKITSTGGFNGAGIGSGYKANCSTDIKITGGEVTAFGGQDAMGIGGWDTLNSKTHSVYISGGTVTANSGAIIENNDNISGISVGSGSDDSVIKLKWTDKNSDSIYSSSYYGKVILETPFKNKNLQTQIFYPGEAQNSEIQNKTLIPYELQTYTIRWLNDDNTVIKTDTVTERETPQYTGNDPSKDGGNLYRYTFTGWTPEIEPAYSDKDYTASYLKESGIFTEYDSVKGTLSTDKEYAAENETVTITAVPNTNCMIKSITVEEYTGHSIELTPIGGTVSNDINQGYSKLLDNDTNTKWCVPIDGAYIIFKANESVSMTGYTLINGDDTASFPTRRWKSWRIYGADFYNDAQAVSDSSDWEEIVSVTDDYTLHSDNFGQADFILSSPAQSYKYFMIKITDNHRESGYDASMIQMSEFKMYSKHQVPLTVEGTTRTFTMPDFPVLVAAEFEYITHEVTFRDYDGTILKAENMIQGSIPSYGQSPTKDHYSFYGWKCGNEIYTQQLPEVTEDMTFTAVYSVEYIDENNSVQYKLTAESSEIDSSCTAFDDGWYVLSDNISIDERIICNNDVHLILCDGCTLTNPKGIKAEQGNSLTIYGQSNDSGRLYIDKPQGGSTEAAIGGNVSHNSGLITINGGTIDINADNAASGIGGGSFASGHVVINGGKVSVNGTIGGSNGWSTVALSWKNQSDSVKADSYIGTVTLKKNFIDDYDEIHYADVISNNSEINEMTLTPYDDGFGVKLIGHSLSLDGDIGVNYYMELSGEVASSDSAYMHFIIPTGENTIETDIPVRNAKTIEIKSRTYHIFKCQVAAKEMTSQIKAQIIDGSNSSMEYTYSVKEYADYLLTHSDEEEEWSRAVDIVKAMLNYGAYSQIHFDKNKNALANSILTEQEKQLGEITDINVSEPVIENLPQGIEFEGCTLSLKSQTTLSLYFRKTSDTDEISLSLLDKDYHCDYANTTYEYVIRIRNIPAGKINESLTVKINDTGTVTYSPLNYCKYVLESNTTDENLKNAVKAFYFYWIEADKYFNSVQTGS